MIWINRSRTIIVSLLTAFVVLAGTVGAVAGAGPSDLVDERALQQADLTRYWIAEVPVPAEDSLVSTHLVDDTLYLYTEDGIVFALQADTGLIRWGQQLSSRDFTILRPGHIADTPGLDLAAFVTTKQSYILDRLSGRILSTFSTDFPMGSPPVGIGDTLFLGSADGNLYAVVWHTPGTDAPVKWWTVRVGGPVTAAPLLYNGNRLIVASQGGQVFSCFARDKAFVWGQRTGGSILADPVLHDDGVIVASTDRSVYKFDAKDGSFLWRHRAQSPLADSPVVVDNTVYQRSSREGLLALDADTGREKWRAPVARTFVAQMGDRVAVWDGRNTVLLLDTATGKILADVPIHGNADVVTNTRHDAIYFVGRKGRVLCARPKGVPYLHPAKIATAKTRLNRSPQNRTHEEALDNQFGGTNVLRSDDPFRSRRDVAPQPQ